MVEPGGLLGLAFLAGGPERRQKDVKSARTRKRCAGLAEGRSQCSAPSNVKLANDVASRRARFDSSGERSN